MRRRAASFAWIGVAATLLTTLLATLAACSAGPPPPSETSALSNKPLPDFHRPATNGALVDTAKARGRVVVVKFFARYCEGCERSLPLAEALHRDHPEVVFVGVAEDEHESEVQATIDAYKLTFPVVHDVGNALSGRYRVSGLPTTFVADPLGTVRWVGGGPNEAGLSSVIAAASK